MGIPYFYTKYQGAPITSFWDKHLHKPTSSALIHMPLGTVVSLVGCVFYNASHREFGFLYVFGSVIVFAGLFWVFTGGLIFKWMWDCFHWGEKLAVYERKKRGEKGSLPSKRDIGED